MVRVALIGACVWVLGAGLTGCGADRAVGEAAALPSSGRAYRALDLNGYARVDLRMDEEGRVYVLEANPNPNMAYGEDFSESAEASGVSYERLLERIIALGRRWEPARTG